MWYTVTDFKWLNVQDQALAACIRRILVSLWPTEVLWKVGFIQLFGSTITHVHHTLRRENKSEILFIRETTKQSEIHIDTIDQGQIGTGICVVMIKNMSE